MVRTNRNEEDTRSLAADLGGSGGGGERKKSDWRSRLASKFKRPGDQYSFDGEEEGEEAAGVKESYRRTSDEFASLPAAPMTEPTRRRTTVAMAATGGGGGNNKGGVTSRTGRPRVSYRNSCSRSFPRKMTNRFLAAESDQWSQDVLRGLRLRAGGRSLRHLRPHPQPGRRGRDARRQQEKPRLGGGSDGREHQQQGQSQVGGVQGAQGPKENARDSTRGQKELNHGQAFLRCRRQWCRERRSSCHHQQQQRV